jgi:hypothetical protein
MALTESNQYGQKYKWGLGASGTSQDDAPTISGLHVNSADLKYEAEVFSQAQDGEGHTDSVVFSKGTFRKITATFTGYMTGDVSTTLETIGPWGGRLYIVKGITIPKKKGEFWEISVEAESYAKIPTAS